MTEQDILAKITTSPEQVEFPEVINAIDSAYNFTETSFTNGDTTNDAGQNNGSCKILSFAKLHNLNPAQTLACFGQYYRSDVMENPNGTDHQNIRQFMIHGWEKVNFTDDPLTPKP